MILIVAIPFLIGYILQKMDINVVMFLDEHEKMIGIIGGIAVIFFLLVSYLLSVWIMERKEIA